MDGPAPEKRAVADLEARREIAMRDWRIIDLPVVDDARGSLTAIEAQREVDFDIARVYYLYGIHGGARRAGHAHRRLHQLLIAVSGSFDVVVDSGLRRDRCHLDRPDRALYLPPMMWRQVDNFSSGAVCLVLASARYDESDYVRDYGEFVAAATGL